MNPGQTKDYPIYKIPGQTWDFCVQGVLLALCPSWLGIVIEHALGSGCVPETWEAEQSA